MLFWLQRHHPVATAALALLCVLAGCSDVQVVVHRRTLSVALTEYRIDPQSVRARAGALTIVVHNYGRRTHNLVLTLNGQPISSTQPLWPGTTSRLTLTLAAGRYLLASTILNDQALGESATLIVS